MDLVQQKLRAFIVDNFLFGQDGGELSEDDSLIEMGVIDSTGVLQLISFLEEEFNIRVEDSEVIPQNLDSLNRLAEFVQRKTHIQSGDIRVDSCLGAA
jgi:acyl carrier protein